MLIILLRRTRHSPIRTKHTAISFFGSQAGLALRANVKKLASVRGHGFFFLKPALRTFENRVHFFHVLHDEQRRPATKFIIAATKSPKKPAYKIAGTT